MTCGTATQRISGTLYIYRALSHTAINNISILSPFGGGKGRSQFSIDCSHTATNAQALRAWTQDFAGKPL